MAITRDDVARHVDLIPTAWQPVVQAVTNRPYDDAVILVDITCYGLGETVYDWPVIAIREGQRGGYRWHATVDGFRVWGLTFTVDEAVAAGVQVIETARAVAVAA